MMIGSFLTRGLVMVFGYAYPAYECFKCVEKNKPDIDQLRFWCQYWILVAVLTVCERIGDTFVSWVPMYSEAKLAFYIYLWYPKTRGTAYVYDSFFRPYISKHETDIDHSLSELRTMAGDMAVLYWQRAASYVQTRTFDILQYVASQSTPKTHTSQPQTPVRARQPAPIQKRPSTAHQETTKEPSFSAASSSSSSGSDPGSHHSDESDPDYSPAQVPSKTASAATTLKTSSSQNVAMTAEQPKTTEPETQVEPPYTNTSPAPKEATMAETGRVTRARLRKASSVH